MLLLDWIGYTGISDLTLLQCFDTVGLETERASGLQKPPSIIPQKFSIRTDGGKKSMKN